MQVTPLTVVQDKPLLSVARAPPLDGPFTVTVIILDVAALAARVTAAAVVVGATVVVGTSISSPTRLDSEAFSITGLLLDFCSGRRLPNIPKPTKTKIAQCHFFKFPISFRPN